MISGWLAKAERAAALSGEMRYLRLNSGGKRSDLNLGGQGSGRGEEEK